MVMGIFAVGLLVITVVDRRGCSPNSRPSQPDGLEYVAGRRRASSTQPKTTPSPTSPLADYGGDSRAQAHVVRPRRGPGDTRPGIRVFSLVKTGENHGRPMSGSHGHALFVHAQSPLHRLAPQVKIVERAPRCCSP